MGLKKLNSEYNSRYKTFAVHRPVTTKATISSHPTDNAPEAMESSRRAGLLSNQFTNVSEPALQRKRIVPYKNNHNILSTSTVKELNDRDWLEAVGNGEDEGTSVGSVKRKDTKKSEDTEYNSSFAKLKVEEESPIILASKAKMKQKTQEQKTHTKRSAAPRRPHMEKSPERLPPAGIPTYIADPEDKRLLRPSDDLLYPAPSQEEKRNSHTEYSERYKSSVSEMKGEKPPPTSEIDIATYKKVLLQRNDAYGLSTRPSTSPAKQQSSPRNTTPKAKHRRPQRARRHSLDSKHSGSYIAERREKGLAKTYVLPKSEHKDEKVKPKTRETTRISPQRNLDEESMSSLHSANRLEATRNLKKRSEKQSGINKHHDSKHKDFYAESVSSRNSERINNETKYNKDKLIPAVAETSFTRPKSAKNLAATERYSEKESVSSIYSARSFENKTRKRSEKLIEKRSRNVKDKQQAWKDKTDEKKGSGRISRVTERSGGNIRERGRSPTPEMRIAGQSRRHHLDITTGSHNPLATGPDPRQILGSMEYERIAYDPSKYSDVGESLTSSRSFATWSDRAS